MAVKKWSLFFLVMALPCYCIPITLKRGISERESRIIDRPFPPLGRCASRIEAKLEAMQRKMHNDAFVSSRTGSLDLSGYALHKPLRSAPYDMYVTDMRIRMPGGRNTWYQIARCQFDPRNTSLDTMVMFRDLTISGAVKLFEDAVALKSTFPPAPVDSCNMTLRIRRAGLEMQSYPRHAPRAGNVDIIMLSQFLEPDFVSVYAYGCDLPKIEHRRRSDDVNNDNSGNDDDDDDNLVPEKRHSSPEKRQSSPFLREVEDVFVRGIQSLLVVYMEKQLQPAMKDTLMLHMGYTLSYG